MSLTLVQADPDDAEAIAHIIRVISGGVVEYLLGGLSRLLAPERLLVPLVMERGNPFSYENVLLARDDDVLDGLLLAYPWDHHASPDILRKVVSPKKLALLEGLLEVAEPRSLYVNSLWVAEPMRGTGLADDLLQCALLLAADQGLETVSLHVWADNSRAVRFYRRNGFAVARHFDIPRRPSLPHDGGNYLMTRPVDRPEPDGDAP